MENLINTNYQNWQFSWCSLFLILFQVCLVPFISVWIIISCRACLITMDSFSFYLPGNVFFFLSHFWGVILLDVDFLVDSFFFQHFEYVIPLSSDIHGFDEKSAVNLTEPLHMMNYFSSSFKILFNFWLFVLLWISKFILLEVCCDSWLYG